LVRRGAAVAGQCVFDKFEPPLEFGVGLAQRDLWIDVQMPREVGHDEQQIPDFFGDFIFG
jgi:hypothetical protein